MITWWQSLPYCDVKSICRKSFCPSFVGVVFFIETLEFLAETTLFWLLVMKFLALIDVLSWFLEDKMRLKVPCLIFFVYRSELDAKVICLLLTADFCSNFASGLSKHTFLSSLTV